VRLDRRRIKKLEAKHPKVSVKSPRRDELEKYFMEMENYQAELSGDPPPHHIEAREEKYDPVLEEYFEELREQEAARDAALQERILRRK
jgi:hypothetical protein